MKSTENKNPGSMKADFMVDQNSNSIKESSMADQSSDSMKESSMTDQSSDSIKESSMADQNSDFKKESPTADSFMIISEALGNIDTRYILEAAQYTPAEKAAPKKASRRSFPGAAHLFLRIAAAAALAVCLIAIGVNILSPSGKMTVTVHAQGTEEEITAAGAVISTGIIRDGGSISGEAVSFYLSGENIAKARFSCKSQQIDFVDYTGKRDEFGWSQNFTVEYGTDASEYEDLLIKWVPKTISKQLLTGCTIAGLPEEMRNDIIVIEITFADGSTDIKAIFISLLDNGTVFASFDDYTPSAADTFIYRADSEPLPPEVLYFDSYIPEQFINEDGSIKPIEEWYPYKEDNPSDVERENQEEESDTPLEKAEKAARRYYAHTVFDVVSIEVKTQSEEEIVFTVKASRGGYVLEPDRKIWVTLQDGEWKVTNEGY